MTHTILQAHYFSKYFPRVNTSGTPLATDKLVLRAVLQVEWGFSKSNETHCLSVTSVQQDSLSLICAFPELFSGSLSKETKKINMTLNRTHF